MFKAFVKFINFIFNIIIFSFFKKVINKIILNKKLKAIIS
jgi:hypothetical protein